MTNSKRFALILGAVILVLASAMGLLYAIGRPLAVQGDKTIEIAVLAGDESPKHYSIGTDQPFLLGALQQIDLVQGEESSAGFYITTVDGVTADPEKQEWWCITKGGEMVMTGVAQLPISNGDAFELTLMAGW